MSNISELQSLLPLVLQDNADASNYAFTKFKYGNAVSSKAILGDFFQFAVMFLSPLQCIMQSSFYLIAQ